MIYLSAEKLSKSYGEKILFENIDFGISKGDKVALIANNGTGKSTLIKILAGRDIAEDGSVVMRDGLRIAYLEQDPEFGTSGSINDLLRSEYTEVLKIIRNYEKALNEQTENLSSSNQKAFEAISAKMDLENAWDYERRMMQMLDRFKLNNLNQSLNTLSGGQRKRLALAFVLLDNPDILLLDEPTNHLDIEMIEWLENYLVRNNAALLMVTHDRYFLDRICTHIIELSQGSLFYYKGNYSYFLEKKAEREDNLKTEINKAKQLAKKELDWLRRSPKARTSKSKSRIDSYYRIKEVASQKMENRDITLDVTMKRIGGKILELHKVNKRYGDITILNDFDYIFKKGERIGILGKNGVGKSSFIRLLAGEEKQDSGDIITGETIQFGHYSQTDSEIKKDKLVIDVIKDIAEVVQTGKNTSLSASQFLNHFMFTPQMQINTVSSLSGGERRRLHLLTVLVKNPNFLILDEPTNDLDLITLSKLEEFLTNYQGCLILVSHDRYFLDRLVDHLFIFKGEGVIKDYYGNYSDYKFKEEEKERVEKEKEIKLKKSSVQKGSTAKPKTKLTYKENKEYQSLEREIESLEKEKTELEELMGKSDIDYSEIEKMSHRMGELIKLIDEKTFCWMELDEMVKSFKAE